MHNADSRISSDLQCIGAEHEPDGPHRRSAAAVHAGGFRAGMYSHGTEIGTRAAEVDRQMQARGTMSERMIYVLMVVAAIAAIIAAALVYDAYQFHKRCGHGVLPAGCSWPVPEI